MMALQMDPERRRKLAELARWHDEWQARHDVDVEFTPENASDNTGRRYPSAEAEREYLTRAREIMGLDPETGLSREP